MKIRNIIYVDMSLCWHEGQHRSMYNGMTFSIIGNRTRLVRSQWSHNSRCSCRRL